MADKLYPGIWSTPPAQTSDTSAEFALSLTGNAPRWSKGDAIMHSLDGGPMVRQEVRRNHQGLERIRYIGLAVGRHTFRAHVVGANIEDVGEIPVPPYEWEVIGG